MATHLMGAETEYAMAAPASSKAGITPAVLVESFMAHARRTLPHLPDQGGNGIYLQNGSRLYIDCGLHPELSSPECTTPWEVVRYIKAGERIMLTVSQEISRDQSTPVAVYRSNVDYSGARTTWGAHESYCHQSLQTQLAEQLIPHLVSRLIYTGAGGFNSLVPGLEFMLSPRAPHLTQTYSSNSTSNRGIFHTKEESLACGGYQRLHLLCGESLGSELASVLKFGTTAIIVALIEVGLCRGHEVALKDSLTALQQFAADPQCQVMTRLQNGKLASALTIQRHYLHRAETYASHPFLPAWTNELCQLWRATLDRVEQGRTTIASTLDWAIKLSLYEHHMRQRGFSLPAIAAWSRLLKTLLAQTEVPRGRLNAAWILDPKSPLREQVRQLTPQLRQQGLDWDGLDAFFKLRQELFEIDTRFSQLGPTGIFPSLEQAGVLTHKVTGIDAVEQAVTHPPPHGRARLRGEAVQRFAAQKGRYRCDWQSVVDTQGNLILDLSNPFATQEQWRMASVVEEAW